MKYSFLTTFLLLLFNLANAQTGNFRSIISGPWSNATTWERDADQDGTYEESPSTIAPGLNSNIIDIRATHNVSMSTPIAVNGTINIISGGTLSFPNGGTVNRLTLNASGVLNNAGTIQAANFPRLVRIFGTLNNSGSMNLFTPSKLIFEANSRYNHQHTTIPGIIPLSSWNSNSTCEISGYTTNATAPSNLNQAFGNFSWNCLNQLNEIDLNGQLTSISGDLNLIAAGGFIGTYLARSNSSLTISVAGDLNVQDAFYLTESGTNVELEISGDAFLDTNTPYFVLTTSSGNAILDIEGNVNLDNFGFIDQSFSGSGSSDIFIAGDLTLQNSSLITTGFGSGTYSVNFDGNPQTLSASITEQFDGQDINILSGSDLSIGNGSVLGTSGDLDVASGAILRVGSTAPNGAIQNGTTAGNIRVSGIRTYQSGSTIVYNGAAAQFIGAGHPSSTVINTTIDNGAGVSLASDVTISGALTLTNGNLSLLTRQLTLQSTWSGSGSLAVTSNSSLVISGAGAAGAVPFVSATPALNNFTMNRTNQVVGFTDDVTINGSLTLTSGDLDFSGSQLTINGSYTRTSGEFRSNASSTLTILGSGAFGTLAFDNAANTLGSLDLNRSSGTVTLSNTLNISTLFDLEQGGFTNNGSLFMGNNSDFILESGAATYSGNSPEVTGGDMFNLTYEGSPASTGLEIPSSSTALGNLTINGGPITLSQSLQVNGSVTLSSGSLEIGSNTLTVLGDWVRNSGSLSSYTGQVVFDGSTAFTGTNTPTFSNLRVTTGSIITFPTAINLTGNLIIDAGANFDANNGTLNITGNSTQSLNTGGATLFNVAINNAGNTVNIQSALNLTGNLSVATASTINSSGNLSLVSTSDASGGGTGTIGVLPTGASVTGDVTVQRFMSGEGRVWRYISSPVTNATVADWQDDFPITGTFTDPSSGPGITSANPSLYFFDESLGGTFNNRYVAYPSSGTAASNSLVPGRGYVAFIREASASTTIDVTGPINQGNYAYSLTYNPSGDASDGYNLVGNPYPATVDWESFSNKQNISGMIAIRDNPSGIFQYWNGSSGGIAQGRIAAGQAFWVQAIGANPTLELTESAKVPANQSGEFFRTQEDVLPNQIIIALSDGDKTDKAYVAVYPGSLNEYDPDYDALKLDNDIFDLSTRDENGVRMAINFFPETGCSKTIPIDIQDADPGQYTLGFGELDSFESGYSLYLKDNFLDETVELQIGSEYVFDISSDPLTSGDSRFELIMNYGFDLPEIIEEGNVLRSSYSTGNQWYLDDVAIEGAINETIIPSDPGSYTLEVTQNGCTQTATRQFIVTSTDDLFDQVGSVYPNPGSTYWTVNVKESVGVNNIEITDITGKLVYSILGNTASVIQIPANNLKKGIYLLRLSSKEGSWNKRIVKN